MKSIINRSSSKAIFNVLIQVIPISVSLIAIPLSISNLGKPIWYSYSLGLTLILLPNYFSFGLGPFLIRSLAANMNFIETRTWVQGLTLLKVGAFLFFLFLNLYFLNSGAIKGFASFKEQVLFFEFFLLAGIITFFLIPLRAIFESNHDYYFLGFVRAVFTSTLLLIPLLKVNSFLHYSLYVFVIVSLQILIYSLRIRFKYKLNPFKVFYGLALNEIRMLLKKIAPFGGYLFLWSIILYSDRFILKSFIDENLLADHVTMQDLFNRVAIISGNLTAVYFPVIAQNKNNKILISKNYKKQIFLIAAIFFFLIIFSVLLLNPFLKFWLKEDFSMYIEQNSIFYLIAIVVFNFSIIQIRFLQAVGKEKVVLKNLLFSVSFYLIGVFALGFFQQPNLFSLILLIQSFYIIIKLHFYVRK